LPCSAFLKHYLHDAIADVAALDISWLRRTVRTAQEASSVQAAIGCLEAGLLERVARPHVQVDGRVEAVIAAIDGAAGACRIDRLAAVANSSRRHLERLFRQQVGLTPNASSWPSRAGHPISFAPGSASSRASCCLRRRSRSRKAES